MTTCTACLPSARTVASYGGTIRLCRECEAERHAAWIAARDKKIAARTRLNALLAEAGIAPCGDNSCMFGPPGGMATNGGCRCLPRDKSVPPEVRQLVRKLAAIIRKLVEEMP